MAEPILKVKNLQVTLEGVEIIKGLSFDLNQGDVLTILGPNGAGKTVLLKSLINVLPYSGSVQWKKNIKFGYVPQRLPYIKDMPMNVAEFFKLKKVDDSQISKVLTLVGLKSDFANKSMANLSSGQFQRVLIARALLDEPDVLLFDEPTTGIDIGGEETVYALLDRLRKERRLTMILVTHDLSVVYKFSNFVICLNKCPICKGVPKEVLTAETLGKLYGEEVKFYEHLDQSHHNH